MDAVEAGSLLTTDGVGPADIPVSLAVRYVLGRLPPAHLLARCAAATRERLPSPAEGVDRALWQFVARHPWSIGPVDAAAALLRPQADLRSRLLVIAAVLEASPECAGDFLPRRGGVGNVVRLPLLGLAAVCRSLVGLMLWPLVSRSRP